MSAPSTPDLPLHRPCLPWCVECDRHGEPAGSVLHLGTALVVDGYAESGAQTPVTVRPVFYDLPPENQVGCVADLLRPYVEVHIAGSVGPTLSLTPAQADQLAAALVAVVTAMRTAGSPILA